MINFFLFSFLSFFSVNAAGFDCLEVDYYATSDEDVASEKLFDGEIQKPVTEINISELLIDPFLVQTYTSPDSKDEHIESVSSKLIKELNNYLEEKEEDAFDYALSLRVLASFQNELKSVKNSLDKRKDFMQRLTSYPNWIEHIISLEKIIVL